MWYSISTTRGTLKLPITQLHNSKRRHFLSVNHSLYLLKFCSSNFHMTSSLQNFANSTKWSTILTKKSPYSGMVLIMFLGIQIFITHCDLMSLIQIVLSRYQCLICIVLLHWETNLNWKACWILEWLKYAWTHIICMARRQDA